VQHLLEQLDDRMEGAAQITTALGPATSLSRVTRLSAPRTGGSHRSPTTTTPVSIPRLTPTLAPFSRGQARDSQDATARATVDATGRFTRVLTFAAGEVTANGGARVKASRSGDAWLVDVNDYEHYWVPDAVISGG
jgi:hypothetical protein